MNDISVFIKKKLREFLLEQTKKRSTDTLDSNSYSLEQLEKLSDSLSNEEFFLLLDKIFDPKDTRAFSKTLLNEIAIIKNAPKSKPEK